MSAAIVISEASRAYEAAIEQLWMRGTLSASTRRMLNMHLERLAASTARIGFEDPSTYQHAIDVLIFRGSMLRLMDRSSEAIVPIRQAVALQERWRYLDARQAVGADMVAGLAYEQVNDLVAAERHLRRAFDASRPINGDAHPVTKRFLSDLLRVCSARQQRGDGVAYPPPSTHTCGYCCVDMPKRDDAHRECCPKPCETYYCSTEHQLLDWERHKPDCHWGPR